MRGRRTKRKSNFINLDNRLKTISNILSILIVICLIIFVFSSIRVKNTLISSSQSNTENIEEKIADSNPNPTDLAESNTQTIESNQDDTGNDENPTETTDSKATPETTINMAFTGDIMCNNTIYNDAFSGGSYDFSYIFENVKYYLQTPDITVGNLETTFAGSLKGYSSSPTFNTPESLAYNLKKLGFDVLSTANNHCYDYGYEGIESTINYLNDADIAHTGTYKTSQEQNTILIKNVKGIKIAFLSFTYGTNGIKIPENKSYSVNLIQEDIINKQLSLAKEEEPDLICVSMHWGTEYQTNPNQEQKKWADYLFENGADIIIGNHPHVLQPMEKKEVTLKDGTKKECFIVYSLGNFIADETQNYTKDSAILNVKITKSEDKSIHINQATYTPIYTYKNTSATSKKFKLIDLKNVIASYDAGYDTSIGTTLYNTFKTELSNVQKLLGNEIK